MGFGNRSIVCLILMASGLWGNIVTKQSTNLFVRIDLLPGRTGLFLEAVFIVLVIFIVQNQCC